MKTRLFHTIVVVGAALAAPIAHAEINDTPPPKAGKRKKGKAVKKDVPPKPCRGCIEMMPREKGIPEGR